jgi:hypothetical protein
LFSLDNNCTCLWVQCDVSPMYIIYIYNISLHNDQTRVFSISVTSYIIISLCWEHSKSSFLAILSYMMHYC